MPSATFPELVAARDVLFTDDTYYEQSSYTCPNGDPATVGDGTPGAAAYRDDPTGLFMLPWGVDDWTFECWLQYTGTFPPNENIVIYGDSTLSNPGYRWMIACNGADLILIILNGWGTTIAQYNIVAGGTDTWTHYVWTVNSSLGTGAAPSRKISGYKNGASYSSDVSFTSSFSNATPSSARLWLPRTASTEWVMAKFAIYHRELDLTDINDHYLLMTT